MIKIRCLFGHKKTYVAYIQYDQKCKRFEEYSCHYHRKVSVARWHCTRCDKLGEDRFDFGTYKVEHGKLIADPKAWSNFDD